MLLVLLGSPFPTAAVRPWWQWSWDQIPRWASGQGATDFDDATVEYFADNFDIMWTQGTKCCWSGEDTPGYETWEDGVISDCFKIHSRRPNMPTFGYYGSYGCCSPYNNEWMPQFNGTNASSLWLRDDDGRPLLAGPGSTHGSQVNHIYDFCNPDMLTFYKQVILRRFVESPHVHGSFFDEFDQFVEGCCGNTPWGGSLPGAPYSFSQERKTSLTACWVDAMEEIVRFLASHGKFAIPSTNAYQTQYADTFGNRQRDALARHGGFKFVEAFCPEGGAFPSWVCPTHASRESCCLDQLFSIKEHAELGIPLMVHTELVNNSAGPVQPGAFLIAAQQWSYVAVGNGWNGPTSFPLVPEYSKRLGAPQGNATVVDADKGVFMRSFEHLELHLNISAWKASFIWKAS